MYIFFCKVEKAVHFPSARIAFLWLKCRCQMGRVFLIGPLNSHASARRVFKTWRGQPGLYA